MSLRELAFKGKRKPKGIGGHPGRLLTVKEFKRMKRRGYRAERELVKKLREQGFKSVRIPVSAPSAEPLPDVFATKGNSILAFEVKAPNAEKAYFQKEQIKKLFDFMEMFAAYKSKMAIVGAKFPYKWVFKNVKTPDDCVVSAAEKSSFRLDQIQE